MFPQVIHTSDNLLRFIYLTADGTVAGNTADPVLGLYDSLTYTETGRISPDETVSYPSIKKVAHYGAYGFWSAEGDHRFVMYMLPTDITNSFIDGSVKFSIGSEVSQMSCTLLNIKGALLNRYRAFVTPGTKMELHFSLGSSGEIMLGIFYIDRASVSYPDEKVSVSARNAIGKLLKEQTFNEDNTFEETTLQLNLQEILRLAEVEDFFVGDSSKAWKLRFEPDVAILDGIKRVIRIYGFDYKDFKLTIIPEEAEVVRMIFADYLSGLGKNAIMKKLIRLGVPTKCGGRWSESTIGSILGNEKFIGDTCLQKGFITDHLTKQWKSNSGELPKYYVEGSHEAIATS